MFGFRHRGRVAGVVCLAILAIAQVPVGASTGSLGDVEVIAVEDITSESDCELTAETFTDRAKNNLVARNKSACPPGSVLRSMRMPLAEADRRGLTYIVPTGDREFDEQKLLELKREFLPPAESIVNDPPSADGLSLSGSCGTVFSYTRYLSYAVLGGRVRTGVQYKDTDDDLWGCDVVQIFHSFAYLTEALNPGEDLFWDQEYYNGISAGSWDMGCKEFIYPYVEHTYMSTWYGDADQWFTDESINDTSFGCEWWGEEYTGSVILDNRR